LSALPTPARYFPIRSGRYDVAPGFHWLAQTFGNGPTDARLFQIDDSWPRYRANKLNARAERFGKYVCTDDFTPPIAEAVCRLMVIRLATEYPNLFTLEMQSGGAGTLLSALTGETLDFDSAMILLSESCSHYATLFDALCCQVQEDIAVVRRTPERGEWITALHICAPSHWAAEDKIGGSFAATHAPVPGMNKVISAAAPLTETVLNRGPFVRFTWGISPDDRLNYHPEEPQGVIEPESAYFRVERQVLWGLPEVEAYVFAIRVYLSPLREIRADDEKRTALLSALHSMSPESRRYKSLTDAFDSVTEYLAIG
jgi:dimethylamine monooxygenase subunit A